MKKFIVIIFFIGLVFHIGASEIQLKWGASSSSFSYLLQVKNQKNKIILSKRTERNQITIELENGKYEFRVGQYNKFNKIYRYSKWQEFKVKASNTNYIKIEKRKEILIEAKLTADPTYLGRAYLSFNNVFSEKIIGVFIERKTDRNYFVVKKGYCSKIKCLIPLTGDFKLNQRYVVILRFLNKLKYKINKDVLVGIEKIPKEKEKLAKNVWLNLNFGISTFLEPSVSSKFNLGSFYLIDVVLKKFSLGFFVPGIGLSYTRIGSTLPNVEPLSNLSFTFDSYFEFLTLSRFTASVVAKIAFSSFRLRSNSESSLFYGLMAHVGLNVKIDLKNHMYLDILTDLSGFVDLGNTWFFSNSIGIGYRF